jgi:hypothetical protein
MMPGILAARLDSFFSADDSHIPANRPAVIESGNLSFEEESV